MAKATKGAAPKKAAAKKAAPKKAAPKKSSRRRNRGPAKGKAPVDAPITVCAPDESDYPAASL